MPINIDEKDRHVGTDKKGTTAGTAASFGMGGKDNPAKSISKEDRHINPQGSK